MDKVIQVVSGWLFSPDQTRVLIVNNIGGHWSAPGGGVEAGETLEPAMVREAYEETGLHVAVDRLIAVAEGFNPVKNHKIVFFNFLLSQTDPAQAPSIIRPDEIAAIDWIGQAELAARLPWLPFDPWIIADAPQVRIYPTKIL